MPNDITIGLPNDYPESNEYSTKAVYRNGHREVDKKCTEAIIRTTFTEKRSTETLPNNDMPRPANAMYKAAFREQTRAPITVSMTTYCQSYVLDMNQ